MEYKKKIVKDILGELRTYFQKITYEQYKKELESIKEHKDIAAQTHNIVAKWMELADLKLGDAMTKIERIHNTENKKIKSNE